MMKEDSSAEQENVVPNPSQITLQRPSSSSATARGGNDTEDSVIDITEDNNDDRIPACGGTSQIDLAKKMQNINRITLFEGVEMIEAESVKDGPLPETSELQQKQETAALQNSSDKNRVAASVTENLNITTSAVERSEGVKSNDEVDFHKGSTSNAAVNTSSRLPRRRTPAPNSRDIKRYKLQPGEYKFGVTKSNTPNKRIIVSLQNDKNLVHEYTYSHCNAWYCRFCSTLLKDKPKLAYAFLNNDGTFDALVEHICKPITSEQSERDQTKIKKKHVNMEKEANGSRKRNARTSSDFENCSGDADYEPVISRRASRENVNYREPSNFKNYLNQSGRTSKQGYSGHGRQSVNSTREVPASEWVYGYGNYGIKDKRIIVFEPNDRQRAVEYGVYDGYIRCLGCYRIEQTSRSGKLNPEKEILFVPTNHICAPRLYTEIEEEQKLLALKSKKQNKSFGSSSSKQSRIGNELLRQDSETSVNVSNSEANNIFNNSDVSPSSSSRVNSITQQPPAATSPFQNSVPPMSSQSDFQINNSSIVRFYHPSGLFLNQCCERLGLTYSPKAFVFWANIHIYDFNLNSHPRSVHQISDTKMSGFSTISFLLTGSENFGINIKCNLNTYICQNCDTIGQLVGQDLSRSNDPKAIENFSANNPTEIHYAAMAHMLNCRFVIYKNGGYKLYGNWGHTLEYRPIFLLQFENGKYSPILSF